MQIGRAFYCPVFVGARLAGEGVFEIAIASKPAPTMSASFDELELTTYSVGARLAGEGVFEGAIAGKPAPTV
ncbi:hypothetical protein EMIT0P44_310026 [Pseudomonas sp. IT-P44]|uniref:hypothetical protein n=1 Tax=Pseudomonas sp. IT-P44 TaxID=3026451 RepID=UPI0039DFD439